MIRVGDIVKRKVMPGRVLSDVKYFSWGGFFIVLQEMKIKSRSVCLIMNSSGCTSWINTDLLKMVVKLNND